MTAIVLPNADIALWTDPAGTRVAIPHLTAVGDTRTYSGVVVQFAGDTLPTPFRGEARSGSYRLTARFKQAEQATLLALLALFSTAAAAADSRLQLRTHYGQVAGLDDVLAVAVFGVEVSPQTGLYVDVAFTAEVVASTVEV